MKYAETARSSESIDDNLQEDTYMYMNPPKVRKLPKFLNINITRFFRKTKYLPLLTHHNLVNLPYAQGKSKSCFQQSAYMYQQYGHTLTQPPLLDGHEIYKFAKPILTFSPLVLWVNNVTILHFTITYRLAEQFLRGNVNGGRTDDARRTPRQVKYC